MSNNINVKINNGGEKYKKYLWDVIYMKIKRTNIIGFAFLGWAVLITLGLSAICVLKSDEYSSMAISQRTDNVPIKSRRGKLLDRNGIPLVENTVDSASVLPRCRTNPS